MAEIQRRTETVARNLYRLDLSQEEAEVLAVVLGFVGGEMSGYRGVAQSILGGLLKELRVIHSALKPYDSITYKGFITFGDTK